MHAHLSGCIRENTLLELINKSNDLESTKEALSIANGDRSLKKYFLNSFLFYSCFDLFKITNTVVNSNEIVERITRETIDDFIHNNVKYLELRTTPKENEKNKMTYESYIDTVLKVFQEYKQNTIILKLLLSVNRRNTMYILYLHINLFNRAEAMHTVRLCNDYHKKYPQYVIGIDLSGDPHGEEFEFYQDVFSFCKDCNLYVTCHCGEIDREKDTDDILEYEPDRLGHCLILNNKQWGKLIQLRIPIEICPTSNMKTLQLPTLNAHPTIQSLLDMKYPFCICTDDEGIFQTSQEMELQFFMVAFNIEPRDMFTMQVRSINYIGGSDEDKQMLKTHFNKYGDQIFGILG